MFTLLVVFGVLGRWAQPAWNFTPLAAIAAIGGFYFRGWLPAVLVPWTMLAVSDVVLPAHDNLLVRVSVFAIVLLPVALGRSARQVGGWRRALAWSLCGFVPATAFFVVTNFAVWASGSMYEPTWAGLKHCFVRGLPFYRTMLAGDLCYVTLATACLAAAYLLDRQPTVLEKMRG